MKRDLFPPLFVIALFALSAAASAHQPFFEDKEFTSEYPGHVKDPTISTAMYATLETPNDVDYYSFNGSKGQSILLSITIPQITGQDNFTPTMALMGPGLPPGDLPSLIMKPQDSGVLILPSPANATAFFEPFSRTSYWTRQEQYVRLPANGSYSTAVWDDKGQVGRYVFVIGDREMPGGDLAFPLKMRNYWTPVNQSIGQGQGNAQADQTNGQTEDKGPLAIPGFGTALWFVTSGPKVHNPGGLKVHTSTSLASNLKGCGDVAGRRVPHVKRSLQTGIEHQRDRPSNGLQSQDSKQIRER